MPVLGYRVQNQIAPPSPPTDIDGSLDQSTLTLTWNSGSRPASQYNIYLLDGTNSHIPIGVVDQPDPKDPDNKKYKFKFSGVENGRTYTFAVRGVTGGTESVDSQTYTLTTNPDDQQLVNVRPVEDVEVSVGRDASFSSGVSNTDHVISTTYKWQCRKKNSNIWEDLSDTGETLLLKAVTQEMDGNQYRLHVTAWTSNNTYHYYSNVATLHIGANPTSAEVSLTNNDGTLEGIPGKGTAADPYTGEGAYTKYTEDHDTEYRTVTMEIDNDGHEHESGTVEHSDPVYIVKGADGGADKYVAVHADNTPGHNSYYEVTIDGTTEGEPTATVVKELDVKTEWRKDNETIDPADFGAYGLSEDALVFKRIGESDDSYIYYQKAEWSENEDGSVISDSVKTYWLKGKDGSDGMDGETTADKITYYTLDESGNNFIEFEFEPTEGAHTSPVCYYIGPDTEAKLFLQSDNGYFMLQKSGESWEKDEKFQNVILKKYITIDGTKVDVNTDIKEPYTYQKKVSVTTTETTEIEGTGLKLRAELSYVNKLPDVSNNLPEGTKADFIITNLDTGAVTTINATVESNGTIVADWPAPAPGLYAIRASVTATSTLAASTSNVIYYKAEGDPTKTEYRLTEVAKVNEEVKHVPPEAVTYGDTIELAFEKRLGKDTEGLNDNEWQEESTEGKYIELVEPDGTREQINSLTLVTFERPAGTYSVRVWENETAYNNALEKYGTVFYSAAALASVSFRVDYAEVTIFPVLDDNLPGNLSEIGITYKLEHGYDADFTGLSDPSQKKIKVVCGLYNDAGNLITDIYGRYMLSLQWADSKYGETIESSYRVTFGTAVIERLRDQGIVNYSAGDGGTLDATVNVTNGFIRFDSGNSQKYGSTLKFTATAKDSTVKEWKINGEVVNDGYLADHENVTIEKIENVNANTYTEVLTLTNFSEDDTNTGHLTVEVSFDHKMTNVTYSSNEGGTISAALPGGVPLSSNGKVYYGSEIVFTAVPGAGQMLDSWEVNGVTQKYPGGGTYRENTLTLTDVRGDNLKVEVFFTSEQKTNVSFSMVTTGTDGDWSETFTGGTITVAAVDGRPLEGYKAAAAGEFSVMQGGKLEFTANISPFQYHIEKWQYRTTAGGPWQDVALSYGNDTFTYENPATEILQVRVCVSRTQTYNLDWEAVTQDGVPAPVGAVVSFKAVSNGVEIKPGTHTSNIPVEFTLELSDKYYVERWENATQDPDDPNRATLQYLSQDTTVRAVIAEKKSDTRQLALTLALDGASGASTAKAEVAGSDYAPGTINLPEGSTISIVAEPYYGQMIDHWEVNGEVQKTAAGRNELGLQLPTFTLSDDTTVTVFFTAKVEFAYPETQDADIYTVENVSSYPSGENSGVMSGHYRVGGDLKFTITPAAEIASGDLLLPYIDGFRAMGENVSVTQNSKGGWDIDIKGVKDEIELPSFRVELNNSIPDDAVYGLKNDTAFSRLEDYLPEGVTKDNITGDDVAEAMKKIVAKEMPSAPEDNKAVYDVTLKQYVDDHWETVTANNFPDGGLTVILPYPAGTDSRDSFTVVHMITSGDAVGTTETFSAAKGNLDNTPAGLQFRVSSLSPIAVIWTESDSPAGGGGGFGGGGGGGGAPAGGGGGGGGGGAPTANVVVSSAANGTVTVSDKAAEAGDNVKLTPKAADGYLVDAVTVTDKNGRAIDVKNNGDGTYSFVMPEEERLPVKVTVTFKTDPAAGVPSTGFVDVEPDAWYREGVEYAVANGLMNGTSANTFAPNDTTTRAMIVTILYRLEGEPATTMNLPFADVAAGKWYSDAVNWASTNGVVTGYDENTFGPDDPITREQLAAILYRYAAFKGYGVTEKADLAAFADAGAISAYAQESMSWANNNGLIGGVSADLLQPQGSAVRAQVAVILMRFCESVAK